MGGLRGDPERGKYGQTRVESGWCCSGLCHFLLCDHGQGSATFPGLGSCAGWKFACWASENHTRVRQALQHSIHSFIHPSFRHSRCIINVEPLPYCRFRGGSNPNSDGVGRMELEAEANTTDSIFRA